MSRSKTLFQLQQFDSELDNSLKRIQEIDLIIKDQKELDLALKIQSDAQVILKDKQSQLKISENGVADQEIKIDQNQRRLYGGAITNPKELEDLQLEATSLKKYMSVLEERQLEAMLETDQAKAVFEQATSQVEQLSDVKLSRDDTLTGERTALEKSIQQIQVDKNNFLNKSENLDLPIYQSLRKSLNGIAVSRMVSNSCSSCGSNIPSAIAQEVRSPGNLVNCPTCKRILHHG